MARQIIISVVLVGALLALGVGAFTGLVKMERKPPAVEPERPVLTVKALKLQPVTVVAPVEGFGTARADRYAVVGSQVSGQVTELAVGLRDGVAVTEGDILIRIDEREYRAQLERARSQLAADQAALERFDIEQRNLERLIETATGEFEVAEREYARVLDLLELGTSSPRELDAARLALKRARRTLQTLEGELAVLPKRRAQQQATCELRQAEVELATLNVERCMITAPFSGRVEQVWVEVGEQVSPQQQLLALLDPRLIEVPVELPVSLRQRVREGAEARLRLESNPEATWTGQVARISPSADEATRTFSLFVEVMNPDAPLTVDTAAGGQPLTTQRGNKRVAAGRPPLMPGMFVQAQIEGPTLSQVLLVPRGCIRQHSVFICEDGKAYRREIQVQEHLRDRTVIEGLTAGQVVITSNLDALYDGAPVNPILQEAAGSAAGRGTDETTTAPAVAVENQTRKAAQPDSTPKTP